MIELVQSSVVFDEENHTYFLGDKQLQGITGMIGRQLFPDKYSNIPEYILKRAAERGTRIHNQCQFVDTTGFSPESIEAENYLYERTNAGYSVLANEYTVSDNEFFASNIDCVWEKEGRVSIADIKTTSHLDAEYVSWQLSVYAYLFEMQNPDLKVENMYGVWLRGEKSELVPVDRKPDDEIKKLLDCEMSGTQYHSNEISPLSQGNLIGNDAVQLLVEAKEMSAYYKECETKVTMALMEAMKVNGVKVWDAGILRVSYTPPSKSMTFDSKKFQAEHPDLYKQYMKECDKKESIRITIRKEES